MKKKLIIIVVLVLVIGTGLIIFKDIMSKSNKDNSKIIAQGIVLEDEKYTLKNGVLDYSSQIYNNTSKDKQIKSIKIIFMNKNNQELMKFTQL